MNDVLYDAAVRDGMSKVMLILFCKKMRKGYTQDRIISDLECTIRDYEKYLQRYRALSPDLVEKLISETI